MLTVRILKVSLPVAGVLIIAIIIIKAITIVKKQRKIASLQDLIDRGIKVNIFSVRQAGNELTRATRDEGFGFLRLKKQVLNCGR